VVSLPAVQQQHQHQHSRDTRQRLGKPQSSGSTSTLSHLSLESKLILPAVGNSIVQIQLLLAGNCLQLRLRLRLQATVTAGRVDEITTNLGTRLFSDLYEMELKVFLIHATAVICNHSSGRGIVRKRGTVGGIQDSEQSERVVSE
jgi:hypothetical protein